MIKIGTLLLCLASTLLAQNPFPPRPDSTAQKPKAPERPTDPVQEEPLTLDVVLNDALANHAQIRLAEAKVAEAEAQLSMAKLELTRQIAATWSAYEGARQRLKSAEAEFVDAEAMHRAGNEPAATMRAANLKRLEAKLALETLARELNLIRTMSRRASRTAQLPAAAGTYPLAVLTGLPGQSTTVDALRGSVIARQLTPDSAANAPKPDYRTHKVEVQLAKELGEVAEATITMAQLAGWLQNLVGLSVIVDGDLRSLWQDAPEEIAIPASKGLNGRQLLALISDHLRVGFVVREYGLFLVEKDNLSDFHPAMTIPEEQD